ncbi:MAG: hypothetical protein R2684_12890 [Pyrinomonadaceae bacterium]
MALEVTAEVFIERATEDVASVMFNPKMEKLWIRALREVYPMESGLYKKGFKCERVGTFLNKHYSAKLLVTKFEDNSMIQFYADEPFEMNITYRLNTIDGGTKVRTSVASISEIEFNSPISIVSGKMEEMLKDDLKRLKEHLENAE